MRPLAQLAPDVRSRVRAVLFDIDDTLTTDGRLTSDAYSAVERLQAAHLLVIPITGRPAGWCDHIARMWPVDGVVGENGAFYFRYDRTRRQMTRAYAHDGETRALNQKRIESVARHVLEAVPGSAIAADQRYRETDLAIDFCEDVPALSADAIDTIASVMRAHGMTAKVSSIHVNGWYGDYDKLTMTRRLLAECHDFALAEERENTIFIGDSPNDAPMFAFFPYAIGVANVRDALSRLTHEPAYVTTAACGAGFREAADFILAAKTPGDSKGSRT